MYKFESEPSKDLNNLPMEALREEKLDLYKELQEYTGQDFLALQSNVLSENLTDVTAQQITDINWYLERLAAVIDAQLHRLNVDDIPDEEQKETTEFLTEEKEKLESLIQ
jgi:hypothetical protein